MISGDACTRILTPVWQGLMRALLEVEEQLEAAEAQGGAEAVWTVQELREVRERLRYEAARFDLTGLNVVVEWGRKMLVWPNVYPTAENRARVEADYLARSADLQALVDRRKLSAADRLSVALERLRAKRAEARPDLKESA